MAKFKKGDRVKRIGDNGNGVVTGGVYTISKDIDEGSPVYITESPFYGYMNSAFEPLTEYTPITPKVGERYRVLKDQIKHWSGAIIETPTTIYTVQEIRKDGIQMVNDDGGRTFHFDVFTTEYLELVEKKSETGTPFREVYLSEMSYVPFDMSETVRQIVEYTAQHYTNTQPIKKTIIQKTMNFIKKLTQSADDKTLEKADFVNSCGDLTSLGKEALLSLVFQEKKADLVKLAEQVIEENKD